MSLHAKDPDSLEKFMEKRESDKAFEVEDEMLRMIESAANDPLVDATAEEFYLALDEGRYYNPYGSIFERYKGFSERIDLTNTPIVRAMA